MAYYGNKLTCGTRDAFAGAFKGIDSGLLGGRRDIGIAVLFPDYERNLKNGG